MHPFFHLMATRPHLLAEHADAYAELLSAEVSGAAAVWKRRLVLNALALCCLAAAAILAGVALMLWAVVPGPQIHAPWALVVAPLLPFSAAIASLLAARADSGEGAFVSLRDQFRADLQMLRGVGVP